MLLEASSTAHSLAQCDRTAGEALDRVAAHLPKNGVTLVNVQHRYGDHSFTASQVERLVHLLARLRSARDGGAAISDAESIELETLAAGGWRAAVMREA